MNNYTTNDLHKFYTKSTDYKRLMDNASLNTECNTHYLETNTTMIHEDMNHSR